MKIRYDGPSPSIDLEPYGSHTKGEIKEYPNAFGQELLDTSKKQHFTLVKDGEEVSAPPAAQVRPPSSEELEQRIAALEEALADQKLYIETWTEAIANDIKTLFSRIEALEQIEIIPATLEESPNVPTPAGPLFNNMTIAQLKADLTLFHDDVELKGLKRDGLVELYASTRHALEELALTQAQE